eukprot:TRINITY_DN23269_c0_g1_i1.p1 TRINITY_DN23269_c0_g1~~TRINITY_DN23269_c0_g1_i1.p1  ORF type:complete len:918 (-),score=244.35 TRINITY_DN23269_c0_g1_i1:169-2652(-)
MKVALRLVAAFKPDTGTSKLVALDGRTERLDFQVRAMTDNAEQGAAAVVVVLAVDDSSCVGALCDNIPNFLPSSRNTDIMVNKPIFLAGCSSEGNDPSSLKSEAVFDSQKNALRLMTRSLQYCEGPVACLNAVSRAIMSKTHVSQHAKKDAIESKIIHAVMTYAADLSLRKLQLALVPYEIIGCEFLRKVRLNNNSLKVFPAVLLQMPSLTDIDLSFNLIESIPPTITCLKRLQSLDMSNNKIVAVGSEVEELVHQKVLKLSGNPLTQNKDLLGRVKKMRSANAPGTPKVKRGTLKKSKVKKATEKPLPVFGTPLDALLARDRKNEPQRSIPVFVQAAIVRIITAALDLEGVFRLAGARERQTELVEFFNAGGEVAFETDESPVIVSDLLKQFLRELPDPLFTFALYKEFLECGGKDWDGMEEKLRATIAKLPEANFRLLRQIVRLMYLTGQNEEVNRMGMSNVAKVIGPNVLYGAGDDVSLAAINASNELLTKMVTHYTELFEKPESIWDDDLEDSSQHPMYAVIHRKRHGHKKSVSCMTLAANDTLIWTGDNKGIFRIWKACTMEVVKETDTNTKCINTLLEVGDTVWIGTREKIEIRQATDGELKGDIPVPAYNLCLVGEEVWVGDAGKLIICDLKEGKVKQEVPVDTFVNSLESVGDQVWGTCGDRKIRVWGSSSRDLVAEFDSTHQNKINSIRLIHDHVWTAADDSSVKVWCARTFSCVADHTGVHGAKVFGTALVGTKVWSYSWDRDIHIWDAHTFAHVSRLPHCFHNDAISGVAVRKNAEFDCTQVFTSSWDRSVVAWLVNEANLTAEKDAGAETGKGSS